MQTNESSNNYRDNLGDPNYKGEKTPVDLKEGPRLERGCTDIFVLLLFIASWGGFIYVASVGFKNGNPEQLVIPYDCLGNQCGVGPLLNYSYLFYPTITLFSSISAQTSLCFNSCPNLTTSSCPDCYPNTIYNTSSLNDTFFAPWDMATIYYNSTSCKIHI